MKRTMKMFLVSMVAVVAVSAMMIAPALAAPANCPLTSGLNAATTGSTCPASSLLQQMLGNNANLTDITANSTCPASSLLQQLLGNANANAGVNAACPNGDCTASDCPNGTCATDANATGTTGSCPLTGMLSGLLGQ